VGALTESQRAFVRDNAFFAVLTTLRADGSPHSSVVWVDEEGGELVFNTTRGRAKERHLSADPRAALLVIDPADGYRWLAVSGTVTLSEQGGDEGIDALSRKYDGRAWTVRPEQVRVVARLRPLRIDSAGL
jgi:PPOX class probable F420-dependent enzyme